MSYWGSFPTGLLHPKPLLYAPPILCLLACLDLREHAKVARAITENKIESTTSLWQVLLRICCRKRKSAQMGVKLLDIMWQHSPHLVTIRTYCVIADTLAKSGSINQVRACMCLRMKRSFSPCPVAQAMELLHNMRSHNIEPNEAIFNVPFLDQEIVGVETLNPLFSVCYPQVFIDGTSRMPDGYKKVTSFISANGGSEGGKRKDPLG